MISINQGVISITDNNNNNNNNNNNHNNNNNNNNNKNNNNNNRGYRKPAISPWAGKPARTWNTWETWNIESGSSLLATHIEYLPYIDFLKVKKNLQIPEVGKCKGERDSELILLVPNRKRKKKKTKWRKKDWEGSEGENMFHHQCNTHASSFVNAAFDT